MMRVLYNNISHKRHNSTTTNQKHIRQHTHRLASIMAKANRVFHSAGGNRELNAPRARSTLVDENGVTEHAETGDLRDCVLDAVLCLVSAFASLVVVVGFSSLPRGDDTETDTGLPARLIV